MIDDGEIEDESDGANSDASQRQKRKKRSEDELSENLEDDDYDLLEENLGVKVQRRVCSLIGYELNVGLHQYYRHFIQKKFFFPTT